MTRTSAVAVRRALTELRDVDVLDARAIRRKVIRAIASVGDGEAGTFWSLAESERGASIARTQSVALPNEEALWEALRAATSPSGPTDLRRPRRSTANRFVPGIRSGFVRQLQTSGYFDLTLGRLRVVDQLRAYLYHGERFVGTLAAARFVGSPAFTRVDAVRGDAILSAATSALLSAEAAESPHLAADLVVRADGRIELASESARAWLARPGVRDEIRALVRAIDRGDETLERAAVQWSRLHGPGGHSYLLHLTPPRPVRVARDASLSAAQRRAAEFLAAGATIAETARAMGVAPETVRTHLREVYRRFGIASRAELARALG